ncbi:hypothetical protein JOF28_001459 [Leucobacter exalbidus]|uniref:RNA-binding protein n=1 Tax=Leucobacter exalbidus TaxID=662960 RepID=A0A940PLQ1_9MICO|nr:RNA-binding protein [Leucobacter exalbidus]MBP1326227.1 hypothetical protein [Leucobacter exalbidus]
MGLNFPEDLDGWGRWQRSRNRLRTIKAALRTPAPVDLVLLHTGPAPRVLIALDATTPTALAAILRPAASLPADQVAVLAPRAVAEHLLREQLFVAPELRSIDGSAPCPETLSEVRAVVSAGYFLIAGATAHRWAIELGATYCVVQHGLLTPFAPPLPAGATLFAFSEADGEFWRSGRSDVTVKAVGSQLLWNAADSAPAQTSDPHERPVFLGQLHGAELPRSLSARTATAFCAQTGATYRPHPAETDRLSRWQHRKWERQGIELDRVGAPLSEGPPVVAIFSTGILEAAAAGVPAWVTGINPPEWVHEFWHRYGLAPWGGAPTPPPIQPAIEPGEHIARQIEKLVKR